MRILVPLLLSVATAAALEPPREWLVIGQADERGRRPFNPDRIFARYLLDPLAAPPKEGEKVGGATWRKASADGEGAVSGEIAYAYAGIESAADRVLLARLPGGATLFVNGDGFPGDVYGLGTEGVPVLFRKGANGIFVRGVRGGFRLLLDDVPEGLRVAARDATLPDLPAGAERLAPSAGIVLLNASPRPVEQINLVVGLDGVTGASVFFEPMPPLGVRKLPISFLASNVPAGEKQLLVGVDGGEPIAFPVKVRAPDEARRRTFVSGIDGSVQEYSLLPPTGDPLEAGVVLTLHGAGVDAYGQARSYSPKQDFWIVAPTNRRPFGFDWQDWGRHDAYEALADALRKTAADPSRLYLTGHSMGGHGTWHLAANDPDRFLAIAPSAGWCSFDTYAGGRPAGKHDALWKGADRASLTLDLIPNLAQLPVFILHGVDDDNVPLAEARRMEEEILKAGGGLTAHYQKGAGHWWDADPAPGVGCVDWPGIFDLFRRSPPHGAPERINFVTADPGVDADHYWIHVEQPLAYGEASRVTVERGEAGLAVTTTNVRRLRLAPPGGPLRLDGTPLEPRGEWWLVRRGEAWTEQPPAAGEKSPARCGPFKRAFANRFVLVHGATDPEGLARARYDAGTWWYRGNGDVLVLSDRQLAADPQPGRNLILYGNASNNAAFSAALPPDCPIAVAEGGIRVGGETFKGSGLGCVFVYPRRDDPKALVGVFGATGDAGARLGYALLPFVSGVGYPDFAVFSTEILEQGDGGVLAAGWFDHAWALPPGDGVLR